MSNKTSEIDEIIEQLNELTINESKLDDTLKVIKKCTLYYELNKSDTTATTTTTTTNLNDLNDIFVKILKYKNLNECEINDNDKEKLVELYKETAKCIAEITKTDAQRKVFTKNNVINALIDILKDNVLIKNFDIDLIIQICRALGNICYANDEARDIIVSINGDEYIIKLLDVNIKCDKNIIKEKDAEIKDDVVVKEQEEDIVATASSSSSSSSPVKSTKTTTSLLSSKELQFVKVRGGLISNYLLGEENLAKRAMNYKMMEKIQNVIDKCCINDKEIEINEDVLVHTLPPLSILTENVADITFDIKLNKQLAKILAISKNPDLAELCLELLHYQAENDDVKLLLAKEGLCETIYRLLEKYKTLADCNGARALMKLACDLIVLILTGDESMHYLYTTPLLKNMEDWLDSSDIDLLTTGVLALGNFARTDSYCIYMVENKIMNKLLDILSKNNGVDDNMRLQHALLSALRNLVIPKPNKRAVIKAGLVQTILPMLEIHQPPVVFKLLGTLRMTVDGQEDLALELLQNKKLIEQLVKWSKSSDFACVTGESLRLMAWLIKHAYQTHPDKDVAVNSKSKGKLSTTITTTTTTTTTTKIISNEEDGAIGGCSIDDNDSIKSSNQQLNNNKINEKSIKEFVMTDGAVGSMINMLTSQHVVMQNEALIALCIISSIFLLKSQSSTLSENKNDIDEISFNLIDLFINYEIGKKLAELIKRSSDNMTKEIVENLQTFTKILQKSDKLNKHLELNNVNELLKSIPILTEYCTL